MSNHVHHYAVEEELPPLLPFYIFSFGSNIYFVSIAFMYYSNRRADYLSQRHHTLTLVFALSIIFLTASVSMNLPWFHFILYETPCIVHFVIQHVFGLLLVLSLAIRIILVSVRHYYMVVGINWSLKKSATVELSGIDRAFLRFAGTFALTANANGSTLSTSPSHRFTQVSKSATDEQLMLRDQAAGKQLRPRGSTMNSKALQPRPKPPPSPTFSDVPDLNDGEFPSCIDGSSWLSKGAMAKSRSNINLSVAAELQGNLPEDPPSTLQAPMESFVRSSTSASPASAEAASRDSAHLPHSASGMPQIIPIFSRRGLFQTILTMCVFSVLVIAVDVVIAGKMEDGALSAFTLCPISSYAVLYSLLVVSTPILVTAVIPIGRFETACRVWPDLTRTTVSTALFILLLVVVNLQVLQINGDAGRHQAHSFSISLTSILMVILGFVAFSTCLTFPLLNSVWIERERQKMLRHITMEGFARVLQTKVLFDEFKKTVAEDYAIENALFYEELQTLRAVERKHVYQTPDRGTRGSESRRFKRNSLGNLLSPGRFRSGTGREVIYQGEETTKLTYRMWELYIKSGAPYEVNISGDVRRHIRLRLKQNWLSSDIFVDAEREVLMLMFQNSFPRFVKDCRESLS